MWHGVAPLDTCVAVKWQRPNVEQRIESDSGAEEPIFSVVDVLAKDGGVIVALSSGEERKLAREKRAISRKENVGKCQQQMEKEKWMRSTEKLNRKKKVKKKKREPQG